MSAIHVNEERDPDKDRRGFAPITGEEVDTKTGQKLRAMHIALAKEAALNRDSSAQVELICELKTMNKRLEYMCFALAEIIGDKFDDNN